MSLISVVFLYKWSVSYRVPSTLKMKRRGEITFAASFFLLIIEYGIFG